MKLSICIVSWNTKDLLRKCLASIYKYAPKCEFEVFVADNNSPDGTPDMIEKEFPQVVLIKNKENLGFAAANNQEFERAKGEYLLILNPDTEVFEGSFDILIDFLDKNKDAGMVAPKLLNSDGSLQRSCMGFPTLGALAMRQLFIEALIPFNPFSEKYLMSGFKYDKTAEVDQPMGACLLVRKEIIDKIGPFDSGYYMFFDEVDLCFRVKKAGWKIFFIPASSVMHHGGTAVKKWSPFRLSRVWTASRNHFFKKHYGKRALWILYFIDVLRVVIILLLLFGIYRLVRIFI
ncbi:MAG: glycosyltransferase family 2 protein [Candidatus Margulisiibacteriota bacterium]